VDAFSKTLLAELSYEAEPEFHEPFWNFMYRFQSLERHWQLSKEFFSRHISDLEQTPDDGEDGFAEIFSETAEVDMNYFPEYLRLSTISFSLSLVENLLSDLSEEISKSQRKVYQPDSRNIPYINKYILWLTRGCGIEIAIDKSIWRKLDAIRELRNRFIHKIDRDISDNVKKVMSDMISEASSQGEDITDQFVDAALETLALLVKEIELSYIDYYRRNTDG
jgi:hypothetical protein